MSSDPTSWKNWCWTPNKSYCAVPCKTCTNWAEDAVQKKDESQQDLAKILTGSFLAALNKAGFVLVHKDARAHVYDTKQLDDGSWVLTPEAES